MWSGWGLPGKLLLVGRLQTSIRGVKRLRGRVQGLNDMIVFGCVIVASLASGGLMNCSGGNPVEGWTAVNLAMAPFLVLAGGTLIWLVMRPRPATGPAE